MRKYQVFCMLAVLLAVFSFQAAAQNTTQPVRSDNAVVPNVAGGPILLAGDVALFQDQAPWGSTQNQSILTARGVTFDVLPSSQMATADLSQYAKVVMVSQQPDGFWTTLETNRALFEDYVNAGGILEMHVANYGGSSVERVTLPFGIRASATFCSNRVVVVDDTDPVVTTPNAITSAELQNWNCSSHGSLIGVEDAGLNVVINSAEGTPGPATAEGAVGDGLVIVTYQPIEFTGVPATRRLNENLLCLGLSGFGTCP